ncbi:MAG: 50S ribosomal protein L4 [Candidatus Dojkabacteria bacterium]|nr:50S ribosomal protein L4 [Candidatus Dojkabacteria bacterium]
MKFDLYNQKGKKLDKKIELEDSIFGAKINKDLLNLSVYIYQANQRQSTADTKTRSDVRGGGAKPWKQKGTGRARHGSIRSPIWKGGGVTFGPRKVRNFKKSMTKKMKRAAIRSAFSLFVKDNALTIVDRIEIKDKQLTKQVDEMNRKLAGNKNALYIHAGDNKNLYLGSRNLGNVDVIPVNEVSVYRLISCDHIIMIQDSLDIVSELWAKAQNSIEPSKERIVRGEPQKRTVENKVLSSDDKGLEELNLSARTVSALKKEKVATVEELKNKIEAGEKIAGIGPKSVDEIKRILTKE